MSASQTPTIDMATGAAPAVPQKVTAVVGFDGSEPAQRALATAARIVAGRGGAIEVVYVAHPSTSESMSALAVAEMEQTFAEIAEELKAEAGRLLGPEQAWAFHRADGDVPRGLMAEAEAKADEDEKAQVVIVVGLPAHRYHQVIGSVPTGLVHHSRVPVLMVP